MKEVLTNPKQEDRDPITVKEALASPETNQWQKAMNKEIENLWHVQTCKLVTKLLDTKLITSRWIFRKKKYETESNVNFKARPVSKDYMQVIGVDLKETFSPVLN